MRRVLKALVLTAAVAAVSAPARALADGYVNPWAGINFGNDQAEGRKAFGVNAGAMGAGIIGFEAGLGWSPNFYGESALDNHELDLMGNIIIGIPVGGTSGPGIRPFVTGGLGLIRTSVDFGTPIGKSNTNDFGYNLGGGVMGFFADHFGLRADVRYYRNAQSNDDDLFEAGTFHFWRTEFGILIR